MFKKFVLFLLVLAAAFAVTAFQAIEPPASFCEALVALGTVAGIQVAAGLLVSILIEYWPGWGELSPLWKRPIVFGLCLAIPVLSLLGAVGFCGAELTTDAIYLAIVAGCIAFTTGTFAHIRKLPSK